MFSHWVGYFSMFIGALWVCFPQLLRGWLVGKTTRTVFWLVLGTIFFPLAHYLGKLGLAGFAALLIGFWLLLKLTGKAMQKALEKVPPYAFRAVGVLNILSGILLIRR